VAETGQNFGTLLGLARAGDRSAMDQLLQQYALQVALVARVRLGAALRPHLDSVDLVQSVHRSLLAGLRDDKFGEITTPEELLALALTMVQRKVARHWRHLRRQERLSGVGSSKGQLPSLLASLSDSGSDPAKSVEIRDQVQQLCSELDETERRMIELRMDGHSTAEVAGILGIAANVLRVRLSRLRQRLRTRGLLSEWL
jgi:RNA polymerase sigma-70 factor (ECF subfamily)